MRRLFSLTRTVAPFLFSERGSIQLSSALRLPGEPATSFSEAPIQRGLNLRGEHSDVNISGRLICDCSAKSLHLNKGNLDNATWRRAKLRAARLDDLSAHASRWEVVDLTDAQISSGNYSEGRFNLVSFRDARLGGVDLSGATFVLCDFSGARFTDVTLAGAQFIGCDFEAAVFEANVNFSGSDLSGNHLARTWIGGADFTGATLNGCNFSGCLGGGGGDALRQAGATYRPSRIGVLFQRLLGGGATHHRRVLGAISLTWALLALAIPGLFFARAISNPIDPDELPFVEAEDTSTQEAEDQND
jgi:uncharacterized protein YjbI with pentapeptide repeats